LSAKTLKYAENRKNKLKTEGCDIVEHLLRKNTVMQDKRKVREEKFKENRDFDKEATFKPVTNIYESKKYNVTQGDKCLDLYSRVKPGQYIKKNIEEPDASFEATKHECNFTPQINQFGCHLSKPD
jgi:hypothetical protein